MGREAGHGHGGNQTTDPTRAKGAHGRIEGGTGCNPIIDEDHGSIGQGGQSLPSSISLYPSSDFVLLALHFIFQLAVGYVELLNDICIQMTVAGLSQRPHGQLRIPRRPQFARYEHIHR